MFSTYENPPGDGSLHGGSKQFIDVRCSEDSTGLPSNQEPLASPIGVLKSLNFTQHQEHSVKSLLFDPKHRLGPSDPLTEKLLGRGVSRSVIDTLPLAAYKGRFRAAGPDGPNRNWEPWNLGVDSLVGPELQNGRYVDAWAWDWDSSRLQTLTGRTAIVGMDILCDWLDHYRPVRVFFDPIEWLAARTNGILIADLTQAWRPLWGFEHFEVSSEAEVEKLQRALSPPFRDVTITVAGKEVLHDH